MSPCSKPSRRIVESVRPGRVRTHRRLHFQRIYRTELLASRRKSKTIKRLTVNIRLSLTFVCVNCWSFRKFAPTEFSPVSCTATAPRTRVFSSSFRMAAAFLRTLDGLQVSCVAENTIMIENKISIVFQLKFRATSLVSRQLESCRWKSKLQVHHTGNRILPAAILFGKSYSQYNYEIFWHKNSQRCTCI